MHMAENTHLLHKGKYHCTTDLLFDWFGFSCFVELKLQTDLLVWPNPNRSNRRSAVQWYFPFKVSECSLLSSTPHPIVSGPFTRELSARDCFGKKDFFLISRLPRLPVTPTCTSSRRSSRRMRASTRASPATSLDRRPRQLTSKSIRVAFIPGTGSSFSSPRLCSSSSTSGRRLVRRRDERRFRRFILRGQLSVSVLKEECRWNAIYFLFLSLSLCCCCFDHRLNDKYKKK